MGGTRDPDVHLARRRVRHGLLAARRLSGRPPAGIAVRPYDPAIDLDWAEAVLDDVLAGRLQARRGELVDALAGDGVVAELGGDRAGLVAWFADPASGEAEIRAVVTLHAYRGRGVATAMLDAACRNLARGGLQRAWLVTTNDALDAIGFYQRRGWRLVALRPGAVDKARRSLKPSIGPVGSSGIPILDELELEHALEPAPTAPASTPPASVTEHLG